MTLRVWVGSEEKEEEEEGEIALNVFSSFSAI